jgi:hypothetical protein
MFFTNLPHQLKLPSSLVEMANNVYYLYYAPTWDWPPEDPIKLGNVLMSVKKPEQPLHTAPLPTVDKIFSSDKYEVEYTKEKLRKGGVSILATFLSILGVGVGVWHRCWRQLETQVRVYIN